MDLPVWPCTPNWATPISETLTWKTDVMQAPTGGQRVRKLLSVPDRSFAFECLETEQGRRILDMFRFGQGARRFYLPIFLDGQCISAVDAGSPTLSCRAEGFEFVPGGKAVLWAGPNRYEVVTITKADPEDEESPPDGVLEDGLLLEHGVLQDWPAGTHLYPVREARILDVVDETQLSEEAARYQASVTLIEPCVVTPSFPTPATYQGLPVLEWRNEESDNPSSGYERQIITVDADVGPGFYQDLPGRGFRTQTQRFQLHGREEHVRFRSLLYALSGRATLCWIPDWQAALQLQSALSASAKQLDVPWMGYTRFGGPGRQHLRVELWDGTVFHRRVTDSVEGATIETLTLDQSFGRTLSPAQVRQINWMDTCALADDTVQIDHHTDADGLAVATLNWQGVKHDV